MDYTFAVAWGGDVFECFGKRAVRVCIQFRFTTLGKVENNDGD
jgi:hypothetical protein